MTSLWPPHFSGDISLHCNEMWGPDGIPSGANLFSNVARHCPTVRLTSPSTLQASLQALTDSLPSSQGSGPNLIVGSEMSPKSTELAKWVVPVKNPVRVEFMDMSKIWASILGYMLDLRFCYITCAAVVVIGYWPSNPLH